MPWGHAEAAFRTAPGFTNSVISAPVIFKTSEFQEIRVGGHLHAVRSRQHLREVQDADASQHWRGRDVQDAPPMPEGLRSDLRINILWRFLAFRLPEFIFVSLRKSERVVNSARSLAN